MPKPDGSLRKFTLSRESRVLLAAALLALGTGVTTARAQSDLASVKARADQGDPEALNALGTAYANGQGVPQDFAESLKL